MVQKLEAAAAGPKRRGRPPAYDPEIALRRALERFWTAGYSATSLDDLSEATGMNRPSLYGAFGDKRALYLKALEQYKVEARMALGHWLRAELPVREAFAAVYDAALSLYLSGDGEARGCFLIGTAAVEAVDGPDIRAALKEGLDEVDAAFRGRLVLARQKGELPPDSDPEALALLASATLYSLAVRARAGYARPVLDSVVRAGLDAIAPVRPGTAPTASADSAHLG